MDNMKVNTISLRRYQDVKIGVRPIFSFSMINFLRPHIPIKKKTLTGLCQVPHKTWTHLTQPFFLHVKDRQINIKKKKIENYTPCFTQGTADIVVA